MTNEIGFRPKARIILQLGDQLIRSESIALLELIKNAYDACAKKVIVKMKNLEDPQNAEIHIQDDGWGMNYEIIKDVWLQPGTTYKKKQLVNKDFISPCNRLPLGEKGIGRFGVHKLGEEIELVSKMKGSKEIYLKINWRDFDNDNLLETVSIEFKERNSKFFTDNTHGTYITIKSLRTTWTRGSVRELYRAITSLHSPFGSLSSFKVVFKIDKQEWLEGLLNYKEIKDSALFSATAKIEQNKILNLTYNFLPWKTLKNLKGRSHSEDNIIMTRRIYDEKLKKNVIKDIDLSKYQIGEISLQILIFDFDKIILSLGTEDTKGLKEYLKMNGGIRVYREGIRVYDYGEPGNDWLNLDIDRVNFPTARISNNIVIGAIELKRLDSLDLIEKTNREGFIENEAYNEFYNAIRYTIGRIITQRNIDKDKLRNYFTKGGKKIPVIDNLRILHEKIESNIPESKVKSEIIGMIYEIESDFKTITEVYIRSASAGLSLSIVIHEVEKIIQELLQVVETVSDNDINTERIKSLTWHLGKLIDGYSGLIRRRSRKESDLKQVITDGLWNIEFRLKAHEIVAIRSFESKKKFETRIRCSESLIIGTIVNIIDNSIWWLAYGKVQHKKIFVDLSNKLPGYLTIIIADNGPGFNLPIEEIIKPFISNKDGGIGIGLHIADEIMNSHGGKLLLNEFEWFDIPMEFKSGAIVGLAFPVKKK